jgi:hypothetical protein
MPSRVFFVGLDFIPAQRDVYEPIVGNAIIRLAALGELARR